MGFRRIGLAAAAVLAAAPAGAQQPTETNVGWAVTARAQPDKPLKQLCTLALSSVTSNIQVILRNALPPDAKPGEAGLGAAYFAVTLPDKIVPDEKLNLKATLRIAKQVSWEDQAARWTAGKTGGGSISQFVDKDIAAVVQPLMRGKAFEVTVTLPDGSTKDYSMNLKGSSAAVNAFKLCLAQG